jgi:hypothetical protein
MEVRAMPKFSGTFHRLIQDSQDYGSDDEHMISRVFFSLAKDGQAIGELSADLKQVVGSDAENGEIEVSSPHGYDGEFNHVGFAAAAIDYFRSLVGPNASGIRIVGARNIRMRNNRLGREQHFNF